MATAAYSKNVLASRIELTVFAAWGIEPGVESQRS
jgi:hypothetical protein